jgi:signal transduction histidine kinase/ligand-binding sensor domain-containing protein/ActR/RegA family two-component response regulator
MQPPRTNRRLLDLALPVVVHRESGLPSSQVHRIAQDRQRRLWMAGPSGLACYDGSRVRSFDRRHGLNCAGLRTVALGTDDTVWIGTDLGVEAIDVHGRPVGLLTDAPWRYGLVGAIVPGTNEAWLGTSQGLVRLVRSARGFHIDLHHELGYIHDMVTLDDHRLVVVSSRYGLSIVEGIDCRTLDRPATLAPGDVRRVARGEDGTLAVGAAHAVWLVGPDGRPLGDAIPLAGDAEVGAVAVRGREVWVGFGMKLICFDHDGQGGLRESLRAMVPGKINDILVDNWGSVWVATDTAGVARLSGLRTAISRIDVDAAVYVIRPTPNGQLLLGGNGFAAALDVTAVRTAAIDATPLPSTVWDIAIDPVDGGRWLATHAGLFHQAPGSFAVKWHDETGLLSAPCRALLQRGDELWVGTLGGLVRMKGGTTEAIVGHDGLSLGYVYNLQLDHEGRLWIGTLGRGLWKEGAAGLEPVLGGALALNSNTYVVAMGTVLGQILVVQDERIMLIEAGQAPRLVASEYPVAGWTAIWLDDHRVAIGASDGLRVLDCHTGEVVRRINSLYDPDLWEFTNNRALHHGIDGRLYCGVNGGLVAVDLDALAPFCKPPQAALSHVVWQGTTPASDGEWTQVDPGKWSVEVHVFAAWMLDEHHVSFKYRLVGFDPEWSAPTRLAAIRYSSLPPGEYLLQVQAQSPLGGSGETVTLVKLQVRRHLLDLLTGQVTAAYDRVFGMALRNRRLLQRHEELEAEVTARRAAETLLERHRAGLEVLVQERTRELQAARDEALRANRAKSDFLSHMSHELRTPMNALLGFAQLMEIDKTLSAQNQRFVKEMLVAGRHLLVLVNEVLDLAQVESGSVALALEPLDVQDIVSGCVQMIEATARQSGIAVEVQANAKTQVMADRLRLRQVLINLMSNAVKYNRAGGYVRVITTLVRGDRVRIEVADSGPGIAPSRQIELFQPFSRLGAEYGPIEGTGIGLAIVRRLMTMMDGDVGVDSQPGEGSRFWIELPAATAQRGAATPHHETLPQPGHALNSAGRVLYVEDNAANRRVVEHLLGRHEGITLHQATNAAEGLALARTTRPDLVLLDLQLPDQDGYSLLRQIREESGLGSVPVVAVTAFAMPMDMQRAMAEGFVDHVAKPIDLADFDRMIRRWLPNARGAGGQQA